MAKNSKVASKKATKSKVSKAPAKKKPAPNKVVAKKAPSTKVVKKVAKPVAKKKMVANPIAKKKVVAKKVEKPIAKKKVVAKKVAPIAAPKVAKPAAKKSIVSKSVKPSAKTVFNKVEPKKIAMSVAKKIVEKPASKKIVVQSITKQPAAKSTDKVKVNANKAAEVKPKVVAKSIKQAEKSVPTNVVAKSKGQPTGEEKVDPLHAKAAKAIKELEERMDLSKVRPRLQAGSPPPKPIRHKEPPLKLIEPTNTLKQKYSLEFEFRSSPKILFNSISDSSGLAGWFADEVHTKDDIYTFFWDQGSSQAKMVAMQEPRLIRFQWLEDTDGTYFQFEIKEDDITADVALIITDFALKGERETQIRLWESQIQQLKMFVGSL
jgi:uncharacterized protein YndB with AHSA1/START domain